MSGRSAAAVVALASSAAALGAIGYPEGPPPGHTGGFGEPTCRACHADRALDEEGGELRVHGLPRRYVPGRTYHLTVHLARPEMARAGFQLSARFAEGPGAGRSAGRLEASGSRTAVVSGDGGVPGDAMVSGDAGGVSYAQQTRQGSQVAETGSVRWCLSWTAPERAQAPVAFHVAANAANDDASEFGDFVYATEVLVAPEAEGAPP